MPKRKVVTKKKAMPKTVWLLWDSAVAVCTPDTYTVALKFAGMRLVEGWAATGKKNSGADYIYVVNMGVHDCAHFLKPILTSRPRFWVPVDRTVYARAVRKLKTKGNYTWPN